MFVFLIRLPPNTVLFFVDNKKKERDAFVAVSRSSMSALVAISSGRKKAKVSQGRAFDGPAFLFLLVSTLSC